MKTVMQELLDFEKPGGKARLIIQTDSDAAKGMLHRVRCGRVRHLATRYFWHREALRDGLFEVERVNTKDKAADSGTKMLDIESVSRCMHKLNIKSRAVADSEWTTRRESEREGTWSSDFITRAAVGANVCFGMYHRLAVCKAWNPSQQGFGRASATRLGTWPTYAKCRVTLRRRNAGGSPSIRVWWAWRSKFFVAVTVTKRRMEPDVKHALPTAWREVMSLCK